MCFGRLIGAATGLEVARAGARKWVEGQKDRQTGTSTKAFWCHVIFSFREKITLININIQIGLGNKTPTKKETSSSSFRTTIMFSCSAMIELKQCFGFYTNKLPQSLWLNFRIGTVWPWRIFLSFRCCLLIKKKKIRLLMKIWGACWSISLTTIFIALLLDKYFF